MNSYEHEMITAIAAQQDVMRHYCFIVDGETVFASWVHDTNWALIPKQYEAEKALFKRPVSVTCDTVDITDAVKRVFLPGTRVMCITRYPPANQPWTHEFYVGTVQAPREIRPWGGTTTENEYCHMLDVVPVDYPNMGRQYEKIHELIAITPEEEALSHREKVARFLGDEALFAFDHPFEAAARKRENPQ